MSALKILPPKKEYAPKWLRKYYNGYSPDLYREIVNYWKKCPSMDIKRHTALDYAKRAQEYDLEQKQEAEKATFRGKTFIDFKDSWQKFFKDEDTFANEFKKHLQALVLHLQKNFKYAYNEVKIIVKGYNPYSNTPDQEIWHQSLSSMISNMNHNPLFNSYERYSKDIWSDLMKHDDHHVQKRAIEGWKIYTHEKIDTLFVIEMLYDPCLPDLIKEEKQRRAEEDKKNQQQPDMYGYGVSGRYTGD